MSFVQTVRLYWRQISVILLPVLLSPLVLPYDQTSTESKGLFIVLLTASFWVVELLPLPITALLPVALRPLLGISSGKAALKVFFSDLTMLIIGGMMVAIALETTMLHKRIAYMVLHTIGVQPRRLMFGIMVTTAFLSMWISNTAASAMMMPVTKALLQRLYAAEAGSGEEIENESETGKSESGGVTEKDRGNVAVFETPQIEHKDGDHEGLYNTGEMEPASDAILTFAVPRHDNERHEQTKQKLDELLSRQQREREINTHLARELTPKNGQKHSWDENSGTNYCALKSKKNHEEEEASPGASPGSSLHATWAVFNLCIAYSANVGGIATLIGSPPNLILSQTINEMSGRAELSFAQWSLFGFPVSMVTLLFAYVWMNILLFGLKSTLTCRELRSRGEVELATKHIRCDLDEMGPVRYNEKAVLIHFIVLVTLLLTRRPGFVAGWSALFSDENYIRDGSVAMAVAISLFIFSNERPAVFCFRSKGDQTPPRSVPSLLSWKAATSKFPWGVPLLLGGGFVLADTIKVSGLSGQITTRMLLLQTWPVWLTCLLIIAVTCLTTELCSNTVITILVLPVLKELAVVLEVHPLYVMFPAVVSTSMAFMLPVATPPNSLVYWYGGVGIKDMVKAGWMLNIIGVCVIFLGVHTWGWYSFQLAVVPDWARSALSNSTADVNNTLAWSPWSEIVTSLTNESLTSLTNESLHDNSSNLF